MYILCSVLECPQAVPAIGGGLRPFAKALYGCHLYGIYLGAQLQAVRVSREGNICNAPCKGSSPLFGLVHQALQQVDDLSLVQLRGQGVLPLPKVHLVYLILVTDL